ncbi:hypothetical protein [Thioalkalivibrio sp. ARh3]|uniref:hypothetical protein n=1 Tax=Thioalkalivibrio sp. ARh3 TaxID=1158148 RepID=UPI0012DD3709|nr:hypothetical protein [Thioalkalivibrio sp. ARh3]
MSFEQTSENNPYNITKRQHYHMQAIIKKFAVSDQIKITSKSDKKTRFTNPSDQCFMGRRTWSEECETHLSHPIEKKFLAQVRRIENSQSICDHKAISEYHLLWCLRYHFSKNEVEDFDLYKDFPCGSLDQETEELLESWGKVPVRAGGKIAGRFKATLDITELLSRNEHAYKGFKWQVVNSSGANFISADCYGEKLIMAVTPKIFLIGGEDIKEKVRLATDDEAKELNETTIECSREFYFGST